MKKISRNTISEIAKQIKDYDSRGDKVLRDQSRREFAEVIGDGSKYRMPSGRKSTSLDKAVDAWANL